MQTIDGAEKSEVKKSLESDDPRPQDGTFCETFVKSPHPQKTENMKNEDRTAYCCPFMGLTDRKRHSA